MPLIELLTPSVVFISIDLLCTIWLKESVGDLNLLNLLSVYILYSGVDYYGLVPVFYFVHAVNQIAHL